MYVENGALWCDVNAEVTVLLASLFKRTSDE
jgi:hypothetical protein